MKIIVLTSFNQILHLALNWVDESQPFFYTFTFQKMKEIAIVFIGGGLGSALRFGVSKLFISTTLKFPTATFLVNIIGCLLIGLLLAYFSKTENSFYKLLLVTGFCGGFTTFSTFSNETILLLKNNQFSLALIYIISSLVLGLLATFVGYFLMNKFL